MEIHDSRVTFSEHWCSDLTDKSLRAFISPACSGLCILWDKEHLSK